jgi:hypothetical protein
MNNVALPLYLIDFIAIYFAKSLVATQVNNLP